jgi:hypothetical protein
VEKTGVYSGFFLKTLQLWKLQVIQCRAEVGSEAGNSVTDWSVEGEKAPQ